MLLVRREDNQLLGLPPPADARPVLTVNLELLAQVRGSRGAVVPDVRAAVRHLGLRRADVHSSRELRERSNLDLLTIMFIFMAVFRSFHVDVGATVVVDADVAADTGAPFSVVDC